MLFVLNIKKMPKKETRGRKKLPKHQFKGCLVACRMQKSEAEEIALAARDAKKEKSEWMRETLLQAARVAKETNR
jgi:hypothetical protein